MNTPLDSSLLYHICDPKQFSFTTTEELEPLEQANALEAVEFGIEIQQDGYNLFAMGPSGSGKHSTVMAFLEKKIAE
jgi:DNA replication protein DnaC